MSGTVNFPILRISKPQSSISNQRLHQSRSLAGKSQRIYLPPIRNKELSNLNNASSDLAGRKDDVSGSSATTALFSNPDSHLSKEKTDFPTKEYADGVYWRCQHMEPHTHRIGFCESVPLALPAKETKEPKERRRLLSVSSTRTSRSSMFFPIIFLDGISQRSIISTFTNNIKTATADAIYKTADVEKSTITRLYINKNQVVAFYTVLMPNYHQIAYGYESIFRSDRSTARPCRNRGGAVRITQLLRNIAVEDIANECINPEEATYQMSRFVKKNNHTASFRMKHAEFMPDHVRRKLKEIGVNISDSTQRTLPARLRNMRDKVPKDTKDKSMKPCTNILTDLEKDFREYASFYGPLINERSLQLNIPDQLLTEKDDRTLEMFLLNVLAELSENYNEPGTYSIFKVMALIGASEFNPSLLKLMVQYMNDWLSKIIGCLESEYSSIRDEACTVLCYMAKNFLLMKALSLHPTYDVMNDIMAALITIFERRPASFTECYIVVCNLMHYCPSLSFLIALSDTGGRFKFSDVKSKWPRLFYYAFRFWPDAALPSSNVMQIKIKRLLEAAYMKSIADRNCRLALMFFLKRMRLRSRFVTSVTTDELLTNV